MNSVTTPFLSPQTWQTSPSPTGFHFSSAFPNRRRLASKPVRKRWRPPKCAARLQAFRLVEPLRSSKCCGEETARVPEASESLGRVIQHAVKPLACAVFFIAVGFAPFRRVQAPAAAAAAAAVLNLEKMEEGSEVKGHEYSNCTKRLLEKVAVVLRCMDEIRRGEGGVKKLEAAMKVVRLVKRQLQEEIMRGMYEELRELKREKEGLIKRSEEIVVEATRAKRGNEKTAAKGGEFEETLSKLEDEYDRVWERVGDVEDSIMRREMVAMSIGVREICFIERECEALVERFKREIWRKSTPDR